MQATHKIVAIHHRASQFYKQILVLSCGFFEIFTFASLIKAKFSSLLSRVVFLCFCSCSFGGKELSVSGSLWLLIIVGCTTIWTLPSASLPVLVSTKGRNKRQHISGPINEPGKEEPDWHSLLLFLGICCVGTENERSLVLTRGGRSTSHPLTP